jgi:taurine dioxygenase
LVTHDFDVSPSAPFGATVRGLDHVALPEGESPDALRRLLDDHGLLVFPDADVDDAFQIELTALPVRHEERLSRDDAGLPLRSGDPSCVSNREPGSQAPFGRLLFHSGMMWAPDLCHALSLYGVDAESPRSPPSSRARSAPGRCWRRISGPGWRD